MQRIHALFLLALAGSLFSLACRAHVPACATDATLLQTDTATPARVTGSAGEHLVLQSFHTRTWEGKFTVENMPMYLLTGDVVDEIATCDKYAFVRYQSRLDKVSTGWVLKARLKITGAPHPRPKDTAAQVCEAAGRIVTAARTPFGLDALSTVPVPGPLQDKAADVAEVMRPPREMVRIKTGGRVLDMVSVDDGGTCPSNYMQVWPEIGTKPLSNTMPDYSDGAYMGDTQEMVEVLGHPLVLEYVVNEPDSYTLAAVDQHGKQTRLCSIKREYVEPRRYVEHSRDAVCRAVVTGQARAIPMHDGASEAIHFPAPQNRYFPSMKSMKVASSNVDLFNDGKPRRIGLVRSEYDSAAGCGHATIVTVPVIINAQGGVDMASSMNKDLIARTTGIATLDDGNPTYPSSGRLVTVAGHVYYMMYVQPDLPGKSPTDGLKDVMEYSATGARKVCTYQPYVYRVAPMAGIRHYVVP